MVGKDLGDREGGFDGEADDADGRCVEGVESWEGLE